MHSVRREFWGSHAQAEPLKLRRYSVKEAQESASPRAGGPLYDLHFQGNRNDRPARSARRRATAALFMREFTSEWVTYCYNHRQDQRVCVQMTSAVNNPKHCQ
ncbi:hypothetical protein EVAR_44503_1 [Eumeta japonica]|uniref:Uncharacterized protein n=1 Tax=Eumeta variegata TaxID=151549 RepID=A0A4C1WN23_EUMVA|nr:hypothetical protein EVAR_44503_1 [Eumeta japonica]